MKQGWGKAEANSEATNEKDFRHISLQQYNKNGTCT